MLKRPRHEPPCKNSFFVFRENRNHGVYFYTDIQLLQTGVFFYSVRLTKSMLREYFACCCKFISANQNINISRHTQFRVRIEASYACSL